MVAGWPLKKKQTQTSQPMKADRNKPTQGYPHFFVWEVKRFTVSKEIATEYEVSN